MTDEGMWWQASVSGECKVVAAEGTCTCWHVGIEGK